MARDPEKGVSRPLVLARGCPGLREHSIWSFCFGYTLGWFAGWLGCHWRMTPSSGPPGFSRSLPGQAAMLVGAITLVLAAAKLFPDPQELMRLNSRAVRFQPVPGVDAG